MVTSDVFVRLWRQYKDKRHRRRRPVLTQNGRGPHLTLNMSLDSA
jgi:hypothetical protein